MTTLTTIRDAEPGDLHTLARLLARAFDEPVTRWLVPDPDRRLVTVTDLFTVFATDAFKDGHVDLLTDDAGHPLAAALWFDLTTPEPGSTPADPPGHDSAPVAGWRPADEDDAARWRVLDELMTRHHLQGPHHYLFAIGVDPAVQGRGLGSRLLTHRHQRLGTHPAYLEATSSTSRRLYQRHGYTDLGQIYLPDGPPLWRMWLPSADLQHSHGAGPDPTR